MKTGLVLEGGGMRGLFTAGVLDAFYARGLSFDGVIGVSAGAVFGVNFLSRQPGRVLRYNKRYIRDPRYMGLGSLLKTGNLFSPDPLRFKKLLLHKAEIRKLAGLVSRQGYTLIPLKVYLKDGRMKLEMGLCRGKHLHDKRDAAAEKDARREIERAFSRRQDG